MSFVLAIDGPAGAGKSTVARQVANRLKFKYLDTGAMYRAVALSALRRGIRIDDTDGLIEIARAIRLEFSLIGADGSQCVTMDGEDVTRDIRTPEVSRNTSAISAHSELRRIVVEQQREIGNREASGIVLEGRDIGTVVFPDAQVKVFLTASPEVRARRRFDDLAAQSLPASYEAILADQLERDQRDASRADSPLVAAVDAVILNTDTMDAKEVVDALVGLCGARLTDIPTHESDLSLNQSLVGEAGHEASH